MSLYEELGLDKNASADEIKAAYRAHAQKHHPDKGGSVAKFQQITRAYTLLSDDERRKQYDATGSTADMPDPLQEALHQIASMTLQFLDSADIEHTDMVAHFTAITQNVDDQLQQQTLMTEQAIAKREKALKRISKKSGENLLANIIRSDIDKHKKNLETIEAKKQLNETIKLMLQDYEYLVDAEPAYNPWPTGSFHFFHPT